MRPTAYLEGWHAFQSGTPESSNPHSGVDKMGWSKGYYDAKNLRELELGNCYHWEFNSDSLPRYSHYSKKK